MKKTRKLKDEFTRTEPKKIIKNKVSKGTKKLHPEKRQSKQSVYKYLEEEE
jgi:hypothetical protein